MWFCSSEKLVFIFYSKTSSSVKFQSDVTPLQIEFDS